MDYDIAQICKNGHVVSPGIQSSGDRDTETFCSRCGAETTTTCACGESIRGKVWSVRVIVPIIAPPIAVAAATGFRGPYRRSKPAQEFAAEMELDEMDRTALPDIIENLVKDNAKTPTAVARQKRVFQKSSPSFADGMRTILVNVITEGAKKMIWPIEPTLFASIAPQKNRQLNRRHYTRAIARAETISSFHRPRDPSTMDDTLPPPLSPENGETQTPNILRPTLTQARTSRNRSAIHTPPRTRFPR